jgi:hypothetical protein
MLREKLPYQSATGTRRPNSTCVRIALIKVKARVKGAA